MRATDAKIIKCMQVFKVLSFIRNTLYIFLYSCVLHGYTFLQVYYLINSIKETPTDVAGTPPLVNCIAKSGKFGHRLFGGLRFLLAEVRRSETLLEGIVNTGGLIHPLLFCFYSSACQI